MTVFVDIHRSVARRHPIAAAIPWLPQLALPAGLRWRWLAMGALGLAVTAATLYVVAVNALLLHGEAMRRASGGLAALERERAALAEELLVRRSPSWLSANARDYGMVEASGMRYLTPPSPVALSQ